jgi:hypothetical protein
MFSNITRRVNVDLIVPSEGGREILMVEHHFFLGPKFVVEWVSLLFLKPAWDL